MATGEDTPLLGTVNERRTAQNPPNMTSYSALPPGSVFLSEGMPFIHGS